MHRFLPLDVTLQTLSAQLYPDEQLLLHQDGVGLYDGKDKSPLHYDGRLHLTSHRLLFVSSTRPHSQSTSLDLSLVRQTEYWVGFLKSNPKITLLLADPGEHRSASHGAGNGSAESERDREQARLNLVAAAGERSWVCRVCGMKNVPTVELGLKCSLCGVTRDTPTTFSSSSAAAASSSSTSLPSSHLGTPRNASPRRSSSLSVSSPPSSRGSSKQPRPPEEPQFDPLETDNRIACPTCTFLNHHSMSTCEVCDSPLFPPSSCSRPSSLRASTPGPSTDPASAIPAPVAITNVSAPANSTLAPFVRLSFRKGGEKAFYAALKEALAKKAWDLSEVAKAQKALAQKRTKALGHGGSMAGGIAGNGAGEDGTRAGVGIDAILRGIDLSARDREDSLDDALKDLESLMAKAKEMITLAQSINTQLAAQTQSTATSSSSSSSSPAELTRAASLASASLASLGLVTAAITPDQVASSREYHRELARELAGVLQKGRVLEGRGGVMGLDEVWCVWNRARGVALVSPKDLRSAAPYLALFTAPALSLLTFPSGLTILHTPHFSLPSFTSRLLSHLDLRQALVASLSDGEAGDEGERREREGITLLEIAKVEGLSVGLGKDMVELVELGMDGVGEGGQIVRDEQGGEGVRWFRNFIVGYEWDGQAF
ncbi:hypothetical protein JCM1841_001153 [Sporobolomyces salmonicolor]